MLVAIIYIIFSIKRETFELSRELYWLIAGNLLYYLVGIILAIILKDNRAFCKIVCPIPVLMKPGARFSIVKIQINPEVCTDCRKCEQNCPMGIELLEYKNKDKRICSTECILCNTCITVCPVNAVSMSHSIGDKIRIRKHV